MTFPHYDREETGYGVLLVDTESGLAVGLHQNTGNHGEQFDECRTGLDHIGFNVGDRAEFERWAKHLTALGVEHSAIRDIQYRSSVLPWFFGTLTIFNWSFSPWGKR